MKQTLLYGSSIALMKGISLLMLPFITHHLPQAEFGKLEIISSIAILGSILIGLGLEDTLYRFVGGSTSERERKLIAARIFTLTLIIGILVISMVWTLVSLLDDYVPKDLSTYQLRLVLLMLALEGCIAVPLGWLRMQNYAFSFFSVAVGRAFFQAGLTVVALQMERGIDGVLEAGFVATIIQALILAILQIKDTGVSFCKRISKQSLIYSLPIMASGLMAFPLNGLDRWVLAEISSLENVGQFGVASKFALAVVLLLQPFGMWWTPKRFDVLYALNGRENAARITGYGLILVMLIAIAVTMLSPVAIYMLLPDSYRLAAQFTPLLIAATLFKEMAELVNLGSYASDTSYAQLGINIISAIVAITTLLWLGGEYGVFGILTSLVFTQALRLVLFFSVSQSLYYLPYPVSSLLFCSAICLMWLYVSQYELPTMARLVLVVIGPLSLLILAQKLCLFPPLSLRYYLRETV
ncbi:lipopolysaccharide biosynthesis protein [Candidatus Enterovibrio escicola]|nr:oligosaccharide flippase family protein [Candidatus Enterovibrio escacola]